MTTFHFQSGESPDANLLLADRWLCFFGEFLYLFAVNILYQGLLDLHSILRNPLQDRHIGHICTQRFLKFTSDVSNNLINNVNTAPAWERPQPGVPHHAWGRIPAKAAVPSDQFTAMTNGKTGQHEMSHRYSSSVAEIFEIDGGGEFV